MGLGCFGLRRYSVFGTSTLGGFRGIGFLTLACTGFFFLTSSCYHERETLEECRNQLAEVVEEWVLIRVAKGLAVPPLIR